MISNIVFLDGLFMNQVLIQQVRLLDPSTDTEQITDLWLEDGKIKAIEPKLTDFPDNIDLIDGQNLILAPGLVDLYSHSGEPGYEERETLLSLAQAAIAGGFTQIAILPDTQPSLDRAETLLSIQQKVKICQANYSQSRNQFLGCNNAESRGRKDDRIGRISEIGDNRLYRSGIFRKFSAFKASFGVYPAFRKTCRPDSL
jgi:hypothetical protein